jgi:hypothetical protein
MFNSFFKKNNSPDTNSTELMVGLTAEQPILMSTIAAGYVYLNNLCSIAEGLTYERKGRTTANGFPEIIDVYEISLKGQFFCPLFIYPYHDQNINVIPLPFKQLNPNAGDEIFNVDDSARYRYIMTIAQLVLTKNCFFNEQNNVWSPSRQIELDKLKRELGYEDELERLIFDEFVLIQGLNPDVSRNEFVQYFTSHFHNKKLARYVPLDIQDRNKKLLSAYNSIIETINRIQAWLDNDLTRKRIEITTLESKIDNSLGLSMFNSCITPFCFVTLGCDVFGRYNIAYGIDSRILNMLSDNMASTLLRRIYEFTPGGMEPFVGFVSLSMDCITHFENTLGNFKSENYRLVEVKRNEFESISDMLSQIELKDDLDEETKKWMRR